MLISCSVMIFDAPLQGWCWVWLGMLSEPHAPPVSGATQQLPALAHWLELSYSNQIPQVTVLLRLSVGPDYWDQVAVIMMKHRAGIHTGLGASQQVASVI